MKEILENNQKILGLYSWYLQTNSKMISKDMVDELIKSINVDSKYAVYCLICSIFDLDIISNKFDKKFAEEYIRTGLNELNKEEFLNNPYYRHVHPKSYSIGKWKIKYETYLPYELFVCNESTLTKEHQEIPNIGYFSEPFSYLAVCENDNEWMMITPNEIATMNPHITNASGNVLTFGLGLGYFAYMCSLKENVNKITIIEKDIEVIKLFNEVILPFFPYPEKIEIINDDAYSYFKKIDEKEYDYCFIDIWHDASDGVKSYLKFKKMEKKQNEIKIEYWIEDTLISYIRNDLINYLVSNTSNFTNDEERLINNLFDKTAIKKYLTKKLV